MGCGAFLPGLLGLDSTSPFLFASCSRRAWGFQVLSKLKKIVYLNLIPQGGDLLLLCYWATPAAFQAWVMGRASHLPDMPDGGVLQLPDGGAARDKAAARMVDEYTAITA